MRMKSKPGTIGALVSGAVKAGLVKDPKLFTAALVKDQSAAVNALLQVAATRNAAVRAAKASPTPRAAATPKPQSAPLYPSTWLPSVAASREGGLAVAGAAEQRAFAASVQPATSYPSDWLPQSVVGRVARAVGFTLRQRHIHNASSNATADYLAAVEAREVAAQQASQARIGQHSDPHNLIQAGAGTNADRLRQAEAAEAARYAAERASRA